MKISLAGLKDSASATPDFTIFTSAMEIDSERENVVRMIGSSTERDLHGDTMAISALTDMAQVEPGLVIWLNHDYELPGSLFGSLLEKPELRLKDGVADLHIVSSVEMSNPNAVLTYGYIKKGTRLGCSIGCMILECEIDEANDDGMSWWPPLIITHVQPLEWSVVGIPANQRSWVENAIKGLFDRSLNQGKVDDALRLAPAMKSLWPKDFPERLKGVDDASLKKELEAIPARPAPKRRIEWDPKQKTFVMNQKGVIAPVDRKDISAFMAKSKDAWETDARRISGLATESTVKSWQDLPVPSGQGFLMVPTEEPDETKGASGKTTWPLADEDTAWDSSAAHKRIMEWAGGDDPDWAKVKQVHFWYDDEKADTWGGYKLPFCDDDSGIKAIPKGVYAAAGAIDGARGSGVDIPDDDVPAVKKKIETYYHKLDKKAPWEEDEEKSVEPGKESNVNHITSTHSVSGTVIDAAKHTANANFREGDTVAMASTGELATVKSVDAQGNVTVGPMEAEQNILSSEETEIHTLKAASPSSLVIKGNEGETLAQIPMTENPANPLDLQLFNALAARFGQPQIVLDASGQIQAPKAFPELSPESVQEVIAKTLNFVDATKGGSEFSKENRDKLQALHDGMVEMCKSSFHPCKEMMKDDPEDGDGPDGNGDSNEDNPGDGNDEQKQFGQLLDVKSEIEPLRKDVALLIETLTKHGIDPKALKETQRQLKDIQAQTKASEERAKAAEEQLAKLANVPLGQPTLLRRGVQQNGDVATYDDFKALSAAPMNANERRWSLDDALKATIVVPMTLGSGEIMNYRKWPEGVGGSIQDGVRPELTKDQRKYMHPAEALAYRDGEEACVPCYDDPLGVEA